MKTSVALLVLGFVVSSCSAAYIKVGSEYVYDYFTTVSAGSEDYVSFASSYNITGTVRLQKTNPTLITVKFEDLKFGTHNGEFSYYPQPEFSTKPYQQLNPLTEPFQVKLNGNNLAESIVLSDSIPEWARNIQRGLATALQLDTSKLTGAELNFDVTEKTVTGECPTTYQVVKTETGYRFNKVRLHSDCENRPIQIRKPGTNAQYCPDENSRDVFNSTSYAVYYVENFEGEPTLKTVTAGSGIVYKLFGAKGHSQYSWAMSTFTLKEVKTSGFSQISAPSSAKTYDNLRYVFESSYKEDEDLEQPHAYFFHYKNAITDEAVLQKFSDELYENIQKLAESLESKAVYEDLVQFHKVSPFSIIPVVSSLPFTHLKSLYAKINRDGKKTMTQLFLDSLVLSGTGPAALLIKDIVQASNREPGMVARLVGPLPNYIRNPTEKLLTEFEPLLKADTTKHQGRIIEFAFASLINRACAKTMCKNSGLLEKYVKYFSDKYDAAENFEEKTVAIIGLRNIGIGDAPKKLLSIIVDKTAERTVRVQAMPKIKVSEKEAREALLPIFYDRTAHKELRTVAATVFLNNYYDERIAQQMVMTMWTEKCPYVKNYLYTFLESMAFTTRPCLNAKAAKAKTALAIFPKWTIDRTLSGAYARDYYDREFNFGHMTQLSVQKSGDSVLPTTIYGTFNGHIASYGTSYLSFFIRMEGLGKAVADRLMSMQTGVIDFTEIKKVFDAVGVQERTATPLKIELELMFHNRVIAYHAADAKTVTTIPMLLKKLQEMKSTYEVELSRMLLLGGVTVEQPTEFGTPVSVIGSTTAVGAIKVKTNTEKSGTSMSRTSDYRLQMHLFGISQMGNHMPAFGSMHTVTALRTLRARLPRHFNLGVDMKQMSLTFGVETPTVEDPIIAMVHATAYTSLRSDQGTFKNAEVKELLKASCPTCATYAVITKGQSQRGTRQIAIPEMSRFKIFEGVKRGAKYFDCEKVHTRYNTIKKVAKYFGEQDKNAGKLTITRVLLGIQYMRDSLFLSPQTQTCGLKAYYHQDDQAKSIFKKLEGQVRVKYTADPGKKMGTKVQFKGSLNFQHEGEDPQSKSVEVAGQVQFTGIDKRDVKLRFVAKDEKTGKNGVLCVEAATQMKKASDFLSYEGENEPTFERKITLNWGPETGKDSCPTTDAYIKATRKAHRSQEQVEEANTDVWPYKQCNEQKKSDKYPGNLTPATYECMAAAIDQTKLRESNITIEYQVDVEARNRWKKPMVAVAALLLPYWDTESSAVAQHVHSTHVEAPSSAQYVKGSVEIDVSARKQNPTLDIHWHGSQGDEHFHNVDLAAIPGPLKVKPVFSRFSPFYYEMFQAGVFGYCAANPATILTFDNMTYHADMSECPTLLAADCDDKPRFAVLSRKIAADKIAITIHFADHKIDISSLDKAVVDGKDIPITEAVYTDDDEVKLFKFVKFNQNQIFVLSEKLSLFIGYTGEFATITAGARYRGTSCGLCGNFDGNKYNDLTGPDATCKALAPNDMVKAYIQREGSCSGVGTPCPA